MSEHRIEASSPDPFAQLAPVNADQPPVSGAIELTEDGIARAFAVRYGRGFRFDHARSRWFRWDGDRWLEDVTARHVDRFRALAREASEAVPPSARRTARKAATVAGAERLARSDPALAVSGDDWDADPLLLGCPGCTVDLARGSRRLPDQADRITRQAGFAPDDGPCPRWHAFLMEALGGDEDLLWFLQVWAGYLLTGLVSEHVLVFIFGAGGNGKSVLANVLSRVMGDYAVQAAMETFVASKSDRHPTELAMLRGARLVVASETEEGRAWAESRIKALTGGDPITARFMRGDFFTFTPSFKLMLLGNHQPVLRNVDAAVRRRFLILPMTRTPSRPDPDLEEKLLEEGPQILGWMIRGCAEWLGEGLPRPVELQAATDRYFQDMDSFGAWLEAKAETTRLGTDFETAGDLFQSWRNFADGLGERPGTAKAFAARLRREGLSNELRRVGGKPQRVWIGIRLRERF